jgi:hypothetical protein
MRFQFFPVAALVPVLALLAVSARAGTIDFGTADPFAVLGEAGVTNTGSSIIYGSLSGSTGTPAVTGFPPGILASGTLYTTGVLNAGPGTPFGDATTAYNAAWALGATPLTGVLGSGGSILSLTPGVYSFSSSAELMGTLLLDAGGSDDASWTFLIGSSLTTASASSVEVVDAGSAGPFTGSITWAVTSAATLGTTTSFLGTILSEAGSALNTGATIGCGRVISLDASVTLDDNIVDANPADCAVAGPGNGGLGGGTLTPPSSPSTATPEPGTFALLLSGLFAISYVIFRKHNRA